MVDRAIGGFTYSFYDSAGNSYYGTGSAGYYGVGSAGSSAGYGFRAPTTSLSVVDTRGHTPISTVALGAAARAVAVDAQNGVAFVATSNSDVRLLNAHSGAFIRTTRVGTSPSAVAVDDSTQRAFVVDSGDKTVRVLGANDGTVLRTVHVSLASSGPAIAIDEKAGKVYITDGVSLFVLNARDGTPITTMPLQLDTVQQPFRAVSRIAVDEATGRIYVLDMGTLLSIDAQTHQILQRIAVRQGADGLAFDAARGRLLLVSGGARGTAGVSQQSGELQVLDAKTGTVLRTIPVGLRPSAVLVDAQADHAVIVDSGGRQPATDPWGWLPNSVRQYLPFSTSQPTCPRAAGQNPGAGSQAASLKTTASRYRHTIWNRARSSAARAAEAGSSGLTTTI